jgi:hypothetical protein
MEQYAAKNTYQVNSNNSNNYKFIKNIFFIYLVILTLVVGILLAKHTPDYQNYILALKWSPNEYDYASFEPTYWAIVYINKVFFNANPITFYLIYESIILFLFIKAINKYSTNKILSYIVFCAAFFPLLVMTQIRQGVAVGIFLLAIDDIINKKVFKYYFKIAIAILFHYSAFILLPLYFINTKKLNRVIYFFLPVLGIMLYKFVINIDFLQHIHQFLPQFLSNPLNEYIYLTQMKIMNFDKINLLNFFSITSLFFYYIYLYAIDKKKSN